MEDKNYNKVFVVQPTNPDKNKRKNGSSGNGAEGCSCRKSGLIKSESFK